MVKYTSCRITPETKDKIKKVGKCMRLKNQAHDAFYSEDYIIDESLNLHLNEMGIESTKQNNIKENDVENDRKYLRNKRIDTNLPPTLKDELKGISYSLLKNKMVDKKLNYYDMVNLMKNKYIEIYPQLKEGILEYKYLKNKMGMNELQERIQKEKYDRL